jgi:hypothetical protein
MEAIAAMNLHPFIHHVTQSFGGENLDQRRLDRELLHVFARDVPLLGDELRAAELVHFLVAVTREPTWRGGERVGEAELLTGDHRRGDRDRAHVLHATRDHEILGARHHALGGEVHGLL